jgi:fatty-acid desaturase
VRWERIGVKKRRRDYFSAFIVVHLIACLAILPWLFSWTGVVLFVAGLFVFGTLGINLGYHRLLTHRSLTCPRWLERTFALIGLCALQDAPAYWVATHRRHHRFADEAEDPHSPLVSFFWAHMGWLTVKSDDMHRDVLTARYTKDLMRDPLYAWLERKDHWLKIVMLSWLMYFLVGFAVGAASGWSLSDAAQFGLSLLVWGAVLRTAVAWHITWAVNSAAHVWGYRNYATPDQSRNNVLVGFLASGEGWHNNHHADPRSAKHGHMWWEFDLTWIVIRALMAMGLAKNVLLPSPILASKFATPGLMHVPEGADFGFESDTPLTPDLGPVAPAKPMSTTHVEVMPPRPLPHHPACGSAPGGSMG